MTARDEDDPAHPAEHDEAREHDQSESVERVRPDVTAAHLDLGAYTAGLLGSRTAFQLDPEVLTAFRKAVEISTPLPVDYFASLQSSIRAVNEAAARAGRVQLPTEALEAFRDTVSRTSIANEALASMQGALRASFPEGYWERLNWTARTLQQSASVTSLYSPDQLALLSEGSATPARDDRTAEAFFDEYAVDVTDVKSLLTALTKIQSKHYAHQLVWRGQQEAGWCTHSSLYRKLSGAVSEDRLVAAEVMALKHARTWGEVPTAALRFFADLQHYGAPTRLLDATLDPEMAAWFAVEADPERDAIDGRVIGWGRVARTSARKLADSDDDLPTDQEAPFWHVWQSEEERARVGWGTGSRTWSWFPPALSERMRAQRAGFLLEAGPLVTPSVAQVISAEMSQDWRVEEISRATSIIGLPSRHDVTTKPNDAHLVPLFSLRIAARAKAPIRDYLRGKGLDFSTVYPDRGGLVEFLKGPFGLMEKAAAS